MSDSIRLDIGQNIIAASETRYKNLQFLGTGGNAATFLVIATSGLLNGVLFVNGVLFALKLFRKKSKPERHASFLAETEFLDDCDHPSIMRIFDRGVYREHYPFLVAEYLPHTLDRVNRSARTTTVQKLSYTLQLLSAINYLSKLKPAVVHRDIKPRNIFVKGESCVLGDFGLIKQIEADDEEDRQMLKESLGVGMPYRYRTPDLVDYLNGVTPLTTKSDVYQLGLVIAEMFTGQNPQRESRDFSTPVELYPMGSIPGKVSGNITNLIEKMLSVAPQQRDDAATLLDLWQGIFHSTVQQSHDLEGKVF